MSPARRKIARNLRSTESQADPGQNSTQAVIESSAAKMKDQEQSKAHTQSKSHPVTPDGRYFVVKDRLWRCTNPSLAADDKADLVKQLMAARRAVRDAKSKDDVSKARQQVNQAKTALGERGPAWWHDDDKDWNRYMAKNVDKYRDWLEALQKQA